MTPASGAWRPAAGASRRAASPTGQLELGTYYWRVAALDKFGLPGERSAAWRFHVRVDRTPPYLAIREPAELAILRTGPLRVRGESEPGATLRLNGAAIAVDADGTFEAEIEAGSPATMRSSSRRPTLPATSPSGRATYRFVPDERALCASTTPSRGWRRGTS